MKVIKVVHSTDAQGLEAARQEFALQAYAFDLDSYLSKKAAEPSTAVEKMLAACQYITPFDNLVRKASEKIAGALFDTSTPSIEELMERKKLARLVASVVEDIRSRIETSQVLPLEKARRQFPRTRNLALGTYTVHPVDQGQLTPLESYHSVLAMEKDDELVILLGKMGAKEIRISESTSGNQTTTARVSADTLVGAGNVGLRIQEKVHDGSDLIVIFDGNSVEIDPNLLASSLWFSTDSKLHSILESRRFSPNRVQTYSITTTYAESFDFDFELAGKFASFAAEARAQYLALRSKQRVFRVTFAADRAA